MTRLKPLQWIMLHYCVLTESKSLICGVFYRIIETLNNNDGGGNWSVIPALGLD